jgi:DNA-binding response OmpR family regulator
VEDLSTVQTYAHGQFTFYPTQRLLLFSDGSTMVLKAISGIVFEELIKHAGNTISDADLFSAVWGEGVTRHKEALRSHISLLNIRIRTHTRRNAIERVGGGYRLVPDDKMPNVMCNTTPEGP